MAKTLLVMLSGGLDSVCVLHLMLTNPTYAAYDIHAHHMNLENVEHRSLAEGIAVRNVLHYLKTHGYRSFTYTESTVGYPVINGKQMRDAIAVAFTSGFMCNADPSIEFVALGVNVEDTQTNDVDNLVAVAGSIFNSFPSGAQRIFPIRNYTKLQVRDMLPKALQDLCWSCRTPIYVSGNPVTCGMCKTCVQLRG